MFYIKLSLVFAIAKWNVNGINHSLNVYILLTSNGETRNSKNLCYYDVAINILKVNNNVQV
jgi:hypothetical protein